MALSQEQKTNILLALFVGALVTANLIGTKISTFFGIFDYSVGIFAFPLTFLITDMIAEVFGKEKAKQFVYAGIIALVFVLALTALAVWLPSAERDFFPAEYALVFGTTLRIFIASIAGFLFSQLHDVWAFHYWKQKTQGKFLWLRNNASTIVSQLIDTVLFMFIAFYAVTPKHDVSYIIALIIPYYLLKVVVAILDTPFVYLGVNWLRGSAAPAQNQQGGGIKGQSPQSPAQGQTPLQRATVKNPQKQRTGRWAVK